MSQQTFIQQDEKNAAGHIKLLVHAAWIFAHSALWNNCHFSSSEKDKARNAIRQYLQECPDQQKGYFNFCQRILLAKEYVGKYPDRFIPMPAHWLNKDNACGFAGTKPWLDRLLAKRSSMPLYKREWKALAEAVLEMASDPSEKNFWYWKIYFMERKEQELWELFLAMVANMQYKQ